MYHIHSTFSTASSRLCSNSFSHNYCVQPVKCHNSHTSNTYTTITFIQETRIPQAKYSDPIFLLHHVQCTLILPQCNHVYKTASLNPKLLKWHCNPSMGSLLRRPQWESWYFKHAKYPIWITWFSFKTRCKLCWLVYFWIFSIRQPIHIHNTRT